MHYYIHAVEASDRPKRAEPYADRLRDAIPGAGHLVRMPSHIYYRVGRHLDAPYMEPPYWYYPVRQSLAAALLQPGRLDDAEEQFQRALQRAPNNGRTTDSPNSTRREATAPARPERKES